MAWTDKELEQVESLRADRARAQARIAELEAEKAHLIAAMRDQWVLWHRALQDADRAPLAPAAGIEPRFSNLEIELR